jgi:hypothetical protein
VYLNDQVRDLGCELLPVASLNSLTLLNAEMVGRSYGGGILKLEPREADVWAMPTPQHIRAHADQLRRIKPKVARLLTRRELGKAVALVDEAILTGPGVVSEPGLARVRQAHRTLTERRIARGRSGR